MSVNTQQKSNIFSIDYIPVTALISREIIRLFSMCRYAQSCAFISVIELPRIPAYCPKTIDFSNDFSFDFDPNFSTLNRFETVQNGIFSLHQIAKNPGNQGFPGFFKYGPEGNRTPVRKPIHSGISHYSHSFDIPLIQRRMTGFRPQ